VRKPKLTSIQLEALRWAANAQGGVPPRHLRTWKSLEDRGLVTPGFHAWQATDAGRAVLSGE
jgi:hypothetical protein